MRRPGSAVFGGTLLALAALSKPVLSQQAQGLGSTLGDAPVTGNIIQMAAVLTVMSAVPALLVMTTSFTRFLIVFSFLRAGLGLQGAPANLVLISLALFMTFHVMTPTLDKAWQDGGKPLIEKKITEEEAFEKVTRPFRDFMLANVREKDLELFRELDRRRAGAQPKSGASAEVDVRVLVPAFMVSELRRGFEIGFLIILPFLVIDLIVAAVVMSMGMMMVSPTVFSLPCKVLFFVLIDGWNLLVGGLVRSFE